MGFLDFFNPDEDEEEEEEDNFDPDEINPPQQRKNRYVKSVVNYKDDDKVKDYLNLSRQPNPSEDIYNQYEQSKPNYEDYKPSFGRKLLAALAGGLGGALKNPQGIKLSQDILHSKYRNALAQHEEEGRSIPLRAKSADSSRARDLAARKFELEEGRRKTDAISRREMEMLRFEEGQKNKESSEREKIEKGLKAEERQKVLDERYNRNFAQRQQNNAEMKIIRQQNSAEIGAIREQNQKIKLEEKRAKLLKSRAEIATISAHERIKSKPEYAQYFNDPDDPYDFTLKDNLPRSKVEEIQFMIRDLEDTLKQSIGLPPGSYQDVGEDFENQ